MLRGNLNAKEVHKKKEAYEYVKLIYFVVQQKLIQYYKATILQ